ncbi:serine threonine- kinase pim-2-like protein [Labeo rohita]|uniref:Serine threonine-kinase pim-2-like protein n=1 Tax=Labeo rohita TaxID=84645 RepID=A0A498NAZ1_LABRO|nr:serine threonine- kinase pim-2-like protein [Labeo rohita]RXN37482.1 serine threonine- kinase pim-2-like protein [Labeo rohita]
MSDIDSSDPQSGPSGLKPATHQEQTDPQLGPSSVKPIRLILSQLKKNVADYEIKKHSKVAPLPPEPHTDSADLQPGLRLFRSKLIR